LLYEVTSKERYRRLYDRIKVPKLEVRLPL